PQNLLQGLAALGNQRKVIERELRYETPERILGERRPQRIGGLQQSHDALDRLRTFQFKIARLVAERKPRRQIAIGADGAQHQALDVGLHRLCREVYERDKYFGPVVIAIARRAARRTPESLHL